MKNCTEIPEAVAKLLDAAAPLHQALEAMRKRGTRAGHAHQSMQYAGNMDYAATCDAEPTHEPRIATALWNASSHVARLLLVLGLSGWSVGEYGWSDNNG